jgi:DNA-binding transcriptional LysR family regulator
MIPQRTGMTGLRMPWNDCTKRRLKLRDLDVLSAVVEMGSMGKAARRLDISQPAVSKAVVELEDALGVKLFDRSRRGVMPTPYGLALARRSIAIFNDLRQGVQDIDFLADPTKGEIRIGTTEPIAMAIVSPTIDRLARKYPRTSFHVVAGDTAALYQDVVQRNTELAICRMIGRLPEELNAEILFNDSLAIMTAAKNPLTRRRKLTLAELAGEPWTLYPADSTFGALIADIFQANGHDPPRPTATSLSLNVHSELLATGRFLTVLPGFMLKLSGRNLSLKALPVVLPNPQMPIGLITLKNRTLSPLAELFVDNFRAFAAVVTASRARPARSTRMASNRPQSP